MGRILNLSLCFLSVVAVTAEVGLTGLNLFMYFGLFWWFFFYQINVKTVEPIWSNFFVGPHVTPGKVCGWSKFKDFQQNSIFTKFWKSTIFFRKPQTFLFLFHNFTKWQCSQLKEEWREVFLKPIKIINWVLAWK